MGYTTDFEGTFKLDKQLTQEHQDYLTLFSKSRRMARDNGRLNVPDPYREKVNLPLGYEGEFFIGENSDTLIVELWGLSNELGVKNVNKPNATQPGLWCQWIPSDDGQDIEWDGGEKFYNYVEWLVYIMHSFLKPWGYTLNGVVEWYGEEREDVGKIIVEGNKITIEGDYDINMSWLNSLAENSPIKSEKPQLETKLYLGN